MGNYWYIDRTLNIKSLCGKDYYNNLLSLEGAKDINELIDFLGIRGAGNPNAAVTHLRDLGLVETLPNRKNQKTDFFKAYIDSGISNETLCLILMLKRNSLKDGKNTIKPFVVIAKSLVEMLNNNMEPKINWTICSKYLMPIKSYDEINISLVKQAVFDTSVSGDEGVLDIWFNALLFTGLFDGDKNCITLKEEYYSFIKFVAKYGHEMLPSKDRTDYVYQTNSAKYGIYNVIEHHPFEAISSLYNLPEIFAYIKTAEGYIENDVPCVYGGKNIIFYGVPGCGKSYHIEHNILGKDLATKEYKGDYRKENIIRTTFYQDYSNTDFVGQILPKISKGEDGKDIVEYIFNPGPFTLALIQAIKHQNEKVALVVEEINRGNAPAIFGDIFQLLDRDSDGISEYGITNVSIKDYLEKVNFGTEAAPMYHKFDEIKIPGNMDIFATMNTSDQNVYTLDTAFTRRWSKERIPNDFNGNEIKDRLVPGMDKYTWEEFVFSVNKQIQDKLDDLQVNEDKQVGAFFVKTADLLPKDTVVNADEKVKKAKAFAYKVLEYLWDDVSKLDHSVIFNPSYKTFEKLVDGYVKNGVAVFNNGIFTVKSKENTIENAD